MRYQNKFTNPYSGILDLDDPSTTQFRRKIIRQKKLLRSVYSQWYKIIRTNLPPESGIVLELGTGAGFLKDELPELVTSDILWLPGIDIVLDAQHLPFESNSLRVIVMENVFHHIPNPLLFFTEAARCLTIGGIVIMIEPWITAWSKVIYKYLHHEPCHPVQTGWEFHSLGPLSSSNQAQPWIIFGRDIHRFKNLFPEWTVESIQPIMPLQYLLSGGFSLPSLLPICVSPWIKYLEDCLQPWMDYLAMFAVIRLVKNG